MLTFILREIPLISTKKYSRSNVLECFPPSETESWKFFCNQHLPFLKRPLGLIISSGLDREWHHTTIWLFKTSKAKKSQRTVNFDLIHELQTFTHQNSHQKVGGLSAITLLKIETTCISYITMNCYGVEVKLDGRRGNIPLSNDTENDYIQFLWQPKTPRQKHAPPAKDSSNSWSATIMPPAVPHEIIFLIQLPRLNIPLQHTLSSKVISLIQLPELAIAMQPALSHEVISSIQLPGVWLSKLSRKITE